MLTETDIADAIEFAKAWQDLGWAVQEQVETLLRGESIKPGSINPNAIKLAYERLQGYHDDLDDCLLEWLEENK